MFNKKVGMALLLSLALVACNGEGYGGDDSGGGTGGGDAGGGDTGGDTGNGSDSDEETSGEVWVFEAQKPSATTVALKGYGSDTVPSTATVTFSVMNRDLIPISGQEVRFSVIHNLSGTDEHELPGIELAFDQGVTDSNGFVTASVQGGTINSVFSIRAETDVEDADGTFIRTDSVDSRPISVNSGRPNAEEFGVAVEEGNFNPWAWDRFNTEVGFTVKANNIFGSPVPDGTAVSFSTIVGQIQLSGSDIATCETASGDCSVVWESGPTFPEDNVAIVGVTVVMAHTVGEEKFYDENANGAYDLGESFESLPEPYLDANLNGFFDPDENTNSLETFIDLNGNGQWDDINPVIADRRYKGASCTEAAIADGHCAEMAYLFDSQIVVMSSAVVEFIPAVMATVDVSGATQTVSIEVIDENGNIPPSGTSATVSCDGNVVAGALKPQDSVPNLAIVGAGWTWSFTLKSPDAPPDGDTTDGESDTCYLDVDQVDGFIVSLVIPVVY